MRSLLIAGLVTLVAAPTLAAPRSSRANDELARYCSGDAMTFCGDTDPGSPAMNACFRKHMRDLSDGCRRAIGQHRRNGRG